MTRCVALLVLVLLSARCGNNTDQSNSTADGHNSLQSLDWVGKYYGKVPCADCDAISSTLILQADNKYILVKRYVGKDETDLTEKGTFVWDGSGNTIRLDDGDGQAYKVEENGLIHLDNDGDVVKGDLADRYRLYKMTTDEALEDLRWELVTIDGVKSDTVVGGKTPHVLFNSLQNRFTGKGCNSFFGTYKLDANGSIKFKGVGSTLTACPNKEQERKITAAFQGATTYAIAEGILTIGSSEGTSNLVFAKAAN